MTERNENSIPLMVPMAKANQKTSVGPSNRNGISPSTVDMTVRVIGMILWLKALTYLRVSDEGIGLGVG